MAANEVVIIDIDKVVASRAKGKRFPKFILRWLKSFIHQEWINDFLRQGYLGVEFTEKMLEYMNVKVHVVGAENIPSEGRFTFASNHPLGGVDAAALVAFLGRKYDGNIITPANDFLMNVKQVQEYLIPVNKLGGQARDLREKLDEAFASDKQVFYFPAGACSRKIDGKIQDLPWKKSFITKSRESKRDIIPMWFSGRNSNRFYNVDWIRKKLKIKTNIAMFFLPDEVYRSRNKEYTMVIGKPIPYTTFTSEKSDAEWAAWVRGKTYELNNAE